MNKIFNILLIIFVLYLAHLCIQKYKQENRIYEKIDTQSIYMIPPIKGNKIKFNYMAQESKDNSKEESPGFHNSNLKTWYSNTWIDSIDENGNPVYKSRDDNVNIKTNTLTDPLVENLGGVIDPNDFKGATGKTIREVYDNSIVDYKKTIPRKVLIDNEPNTNYQEGGSGLSYITPDTWVYEDEKPENGGEILKGLYAVDPNTLGPASIV